MFLSQRARPHFMQIVGKTSKSDCMKMQRGGFKFSKRKMSTSKYLRPFRNRDSGEFRNNLSTASAALFFLDA